MSAPTTPRFAVLTNRKRALIALIHSVVFLAIALHGFISPRRPIVLHGTGAASGVALVAIYVVVASILAWLAGISRCTLERIYFVLCVTSASCGLLRTAWGDAALPFAQPLRTTALICAVVVGVRIYRGFAAVSPAAQPTGLTPQSAAAFTLDPQEPS